MRYWQYDDEADCNDPTRRSSYDDRRSTIDDQWSTNRRSTFDARCSMLDVDLHYAETVGQNLNSNLTLTKVHQVEVELACGQPQSMPGLFLLYLAESIIILTASS